MTTLNKINNLANVHGLKLKESNLSEPLTLVFTLPPMANVLAIIIDFNEQIPEATLSSDEKTITLKIDAPPVEDNHVNVGEISSKRLPHQSGSNVKVSERVKHIEETLHAKR